MRKLRCSIILLTTLSFLCACDSQLGKDAYKAAEYAGVSSAIDAITVVDVPICPRGSLGLDYERHGESSDCLSEIAHANLKENGTSVTSLLNRGKSRGLTTGQTLYTLNAFAAATDPEQNALREARQRAQTEELKEMLRNAAATAEAEELKRGLEGRRVAEESTRRQQEEYANRAREIAETEEAYRDCSYAADSAKPCPSNAQWASAQQSTAGTPPPLRDMQQRDREAKLAELREQQAQARRETEFAEQRLKQIADERAQKELGGNHTSELGLTTQYATAIHDAILRNWTRPENLPIGQKCAVQITQLRGGMVVNVEVAPSCPFDEPGRRSVAAAVRKAQPLPYDGFESAFNRTINLNFIAADH